MKHLNAKFRYHFFDIQALLVQFPNPNTEIWTLFANSVIGDAHRDKAGAFIYRHLTLYRRNVTCFIQATCTYRSVNTFYLDYTKTNQIIM